MTLQPVAAGVGDCGVDVAFGERDAASGGGIEAGADEGGRADDAAKASEEGFVVVSGGLKARPNRKNGGGGEGRGGKHGRKATTG